MRSSRVQNDVDESIRESRRKLETEIRELLAEVSAIAERALGRARSAKAAGAPAVAKSQAKLDAVELEVRGFLSSRVYYICS
jgi:hypothetical protein